MRIRRPRRKGELYPSAAARFIQAAGGGILTAGGLAEGFDKTRRGLYNDRGNNG